MSYVSILAGTGTLIGTSTNIIISDLSATLEYGPEEDELSVPPQSSFLRQRLLSTDLQRDPEVQIIAIKRQQMHFSEQKIRDIRLHEGDIVLVRCSRQKLRPHAVADTHAHPDHFGGLGNDVDCPVYATGDTWEKITDMQIAQRAGRICQRRDAVVLR